MSVKNNFSRLLKSLRTKSNIGWTQASIAEELGIGRRTYIGWENGENIPSPEYLEQIVSLLRLSKEDEDALYRAAAQTSPRIHNIPFPQNPFFTGREALLERIKQFLEENGTVAVSQPICVSGLGGIGKTQLALEYAHRSYPNVYRAVFWMNAANKTYLQHDYISLAHLLKLPEQHDDNVEQQVKAVRRWLEDHTNWLLIMDNADDLQVARPYLPVKPGGHILLTTRSQIVGTIGRRLDIDKMEPAEGLCFLLRRSGLIKDEMEIATLPLYTRDSASKLVELLGGYPLALDQAGAYIEETCISLADYIRHYGEARQFLLNRRGSLESEYDGHPESVTVTIELSLRKACEQHPKAADIMYFCSFFYPDCIPENIVQEDVGLQIDTKTFYELIAILRHYSLVKRDTIDKSLSVHPLVQAVLKDSMPSDLRQQWRERIIRTLDAILPTEVMELMRFRNWDGKRQIGILT